MMKKLKRVIKTNWNLNPKQIDKDLSIIALAEQIACATEKCTVEEAYGMWIGNENLHLPGLIAIMILDDMGCDTKNLNADMTIREIFNL